MKLSPEKIEELAKRPGVRRVAVVNFLSTLEGLTYEEARMNLEMDASAYRWTAETVGAIWDGLAEARKST